MKFNTERYEMRNQTRLSIAHTTKKTVRPELDGEVACGHNTAEPFPDLPEKVPRKQLEPLLELDLRS